MKKKWWAAMSWLLASGAWAHPGHPALSRTHAHVFGVDPVWVAVAGVAVVTGAVLIVRRRGSRARVLK